MPGEPVPADPGWDEGPAWDAPDPVPAAEREAWLDHLAAQDDPVEAEEDPGPEVELTAEELAEVRGAAVPAAAFGSGAALDVMPGCPELALFADAAAGADDGYAGVCDDELTGAVRAWDRVEARAAARKLAAIAEQVRRHPEPGCAPEGPGRIPAGWDEFTADELAWALAESRGRAEDLLTLAVRDARVQRWAEDSGNAALMGRELPPAEVLAADQRITAWARQLKAAGRPGISRPPVSNTSTYRTVASAGSATGVRHVH
jgi:hypothetical protein